MTNIDIYKMDETETVKFAHLLGNTYFYRDGKLYRKIFESRDYTKLGVKINSYNVQSGNLCWTDSEAEVIEVEKIKIYTKSRPKSILWID